jgi:hypothetical protein
MHHSVTLFAVRLSLALTALVILGLSLPSTAQAAPQECVNVQGTAAGHSTGPTSFESTVVGDLAGTLFGTNFTIVKVGDHGAIHYTVLHRFETPQGDLYAVAEGVLTPTAPPIYGANERNVITGGTGAYAGATGRIQIHAIIDLSTGLFSIRYQGRICIPE